MSITKKIPSRLLTMTTLNQIALKIVHYPTKTSMDADTAVVWDAIMEATGGGIPILTEGGFYAETAIVLSLWRSKGYYNIWERSVLVMLDLLGILACPG